MTLRKALYLFFGTFIGLPFVAGGAGVALQASSLAQGYQTPTLASEEPALDVGHGGVAPGHEHHPADEGSHDASGQQDGRQMHGRPTGLRHQVTHHAHAHQGAPHPSTP